jgi:creatine kinase
MQSCTRAHARAFAAAALAVVAAPAVVAIVIGNNPHQVPDQLSEKDDDYPMSLLYRQYRSTATTATFWLTKGSTGCQALLNEKVPVHTENTERSDDPLLSRHHPIASSYPNLSRHTKHSALKQFLTEEVYEQLRHKTTASGIGLEDIIRAGVSLPHGAYRRGVYAGDAESYDTFQLLFSPMIAQRHKLQGRSDDSKTGTTSTGLAPLQQQPQQLHPPRLAVQLQKFLTNLDPGELSQKQIDPKGDYILFTRMRLARSIQGFRFSPCIARAERRQVEQILRSCFVQWDGTYTPVMELTNKQHSQLVRNQVLFGDPDEHAIAAGFGSDWPDARGFYCDVPWQSASPELIIWCNAKDHIRIISREKGGNVQAVFTRLSQAVWQLESDLNDLGYKFVEHRRLGFLNSSPSDIGTALRASVVIKLVRLGQHPQFEDIVRRLHLEVAAKDGSQRQYSGIFDVGNAEALGKTEVQLINIMIHGVGKLIDLERRLEQGEQITPEDIAANQIGPTSQH